MTKPYPWYYAVNDRPVMLVELANGGVDCLVFDFKTGAFVPDRSYFGKVSDTGIGKDVDQFTKEKFDERVAAMRRPISEARRAARIEWEATGDGEHPFRAMIGERVLVIRVNDFPAEPLYTLLVDGQEVENLEDWPPAWVKPQSTRA